jgi:hypothetical protein
MFYKKDDYEMRGAGRKAGSKGNGRRIHAPGGKRSFKASSSMMAEWTQKRVPVRKPDQAGAAKLRRVEKNSPSYHLWVSHI